MIHESFIALNLHINSEMGQYFVGSSLMTNCMYIDRKSKADLMLAQLLSALCLCFLALLSSSSSLLVYVYFYLFFSPIRPSRTVDLTQLTCFQSTVDMTNKIIRSNSSSIQVNDHAIKS